MNTASPDLYDDSPEFDSTHVESGAFDLQHYLRILRKYKWPITLFTAVLTALAAYYAFTATPIYRATSTLLIEQQQINMPTLEELYGLDKENSDYYQTQFELLKSRNLAQQVIERLDLWEDPELYRIKPQNPADNSSERTSTVDGSAGTSGVLSTVTGWVDQALGKTTDAVESDAPVGAEPVASTNSPAVAAESAGVPDLFDPSVLPPGVSAQDAAFAALEGVDDFTQNRIALAPEKELVVNNFISSLTISPVRKTKLVNISFDSADPVLAARIANTVGDEYIKSYLDARLERTASASDWLREQLGKLEIDRDEAEGRLIAYKEDNGLVDVEGSVGRLNEQEILLLTAEVTQARSELASAESVFREVQRLRAQPDLLESIPAVQADPLVQRTKIDQGAVQRELDELLSRYGERHPNVVDRQSELASVSATLTGHVNRVVGSLAQDAEFARQRVAEIEAKRLTGRAEIAAIGTKTFELESLEREVDAKRDIYNQFFNRLTEAQSAEGLEVPNARVSDFARPPVNPVKPNKQLLIALAALGSLFLSMLMAFLYEAMDDTVKGTNDVEQRLGVRLLGILPLVKGGMLKRKRDLPLDPSTIEDKRGTFGEAVNTARTALCLEDGTGARKVIVVTSSVPGEGKSTASINLAYSFGQLERVLLIDCDMRRPTIAKAANLDRNSSGLSNLIGRNTPARECIWQGQFGGSVDVLPSGPLPDQPLELLSSRRFERTLEELSKHYDRIIIDSAPTQAVSDALVLSRYADSVVYVVKSHDTSMDLVRRGLQRLREAGSHVSGILMTQVDVEKLTSYGGDYYYQGYYDYYGYTEKGESRQRDSGRIRLTQAELIAIKRDDDFDLGLGAVPNEVSKPARVHASSVRSMPTGSTARERPAKQRFAGGDLDIL